MANIAPPLTVDGRRRASIAWSQGTSLYAQLNVPRQQAAPMRRKRSVQAGRDFQILEEEPEQNDTEPAAETLPPRPTASIARPRQSRTSLVAPLHPVHEGTSIMPAITEGESGTTQITREPRRRTIFVPSDNTTVSTIHPGVKAREDKEGKNADLTAPARLRRPARTSILAAPRRGPLQTVKAPQTANNVIDRDGRATGKENIAPGLLSVGMEEKAGPPVTRSPVSMAGRRDSVLLARPPATNMAISTRTGPAPRVKAPSSEHQGREKVPRLSTARTIVRQTTHQAKPVLNLRDYPPLEENISHAQMFEDSWLDNQEHVLVELMNDVFARSEETRKMPARKIVREQLLRLYQDKNTLRLHQRLQASLQFGTLSVAKDSEGAVEAYRYKKDVGRRGRFIKLWTQAYQPTFLRAALEVVIGRQMTTQSGERCSSRDFSTFVEGFLLNNEDAEAPEHAREGTDAIAWSWRRTMQRSLMLVYVLDKAKEKLSLRGNLFQRASPLKSSAAVLNELSRILHPSERTTQHCLNHLGYQISHEQHPLADFPWTVTNLPTELRDGMRLGRLVELLLPPCSLDDSSIDRRPSWGTPDTDTTDPASSSRYLTPHLRTPCTSRATMLSNNELILDNLRSSNSLDAVTSEISAADLTDGHREKTLALLWALLGAAGLQRMVDWDDVASEITHLQSHPTASNEGTTMLCDNQAQALGAPRLEPLLEWTRLIAAKRGLAISNLSTAFADGRVFEALVDEYGPLLPSTTLSTPAGASSSATPKSAASTRTSDHAHAHPHAHARPLEAKLLRLGCTPTFASIFSFGSRSHSRSSSSSNSSCTGRFVDADFTIAALLFLASRLLSGSRAERQRRATLKTLAADCATVVQTRLQLEHAATVLQRRWREVLTWKGEQRQRRREEDAAEAEVDEEAWHERETHANENEIENEGNVLEREVDVDFWMV